MPFVRNAADVAQLVSRVFAGRGIQCSFRASTVPDFYVERALPNGMRPQRYLAAVVAVFAEILPDHAALTIDVRPGALVLESPALGARYYLPADTLKRTPAGPIVDTDLFLASYVLWLDTAPTLNPRSISVPIAAAEAVREKISPEAVRHVGQLMAGGKGLRWRRREARTLGAVTDFIRGAKVAELVWAALQTLDGELQLVSWPAILCSAMRTCCDGRHFPQV